MKKTAILTGATLLGIIILLMEVSIIGIGVETIGDIWYAMTAFRIPKWDLMLSGSFVLLISATIAIGIPTGIVYAIPQIKKVF